MNARALRPLLCQGRLAGEFISALPRASHAATGRNLLRRDENDNEESDKANDKASYDV